MKNQVTSIEQSRWLIGLGVPAEKASMKWEYWINPDFSKDPPEEGFYNLNTKESRKADPCDRDVPAFTVADLLGMMPKKITTQRGKVHMLHIGPCSSTSPCWCLYWGDEDVQVGWQERISFLHLLKDAIEWLVSNGYKLEV